LVNYPARVDAPLSAPLSGIVATSTVERKFIYRRAVAYDETLLNRIVNRRAKGASSHGGYPEFCPG